MFQSYFKKSHWEATVCIFLGPPKLIDSKTKPTNNRQQWQKRPLLSQQCFFCAHALLFIISFTPIVFSPSSHNLSPLTFASILCARYREDIRNWHEKWIQNWINKQITDLCLCRWRSFSVSWFYFMNVKYCNNSLSIELNVWDMVELAHSYRYLVHRHRI